MVLSPVALLMYMVMHYPAGLQSSHTQLRPFPTSLENLGENDPLPAPPPQGAPHSQQPDGTWFQSNNESGVTRGRSVSWAGQHVSV